MVGELYIEVTCLNDARWDEDILDAEMKRVLRRIQYTRRLSITNKRSTSGGTNSSATASESFFKSSSRTSCHGNSILRKDTDITSNTGNSEIKTTPRYNNNTKKIEVKRNTVSSSSNKSPVMTTRSKSNVTDASFFVLSLKNEDHRGYCEGADENPLDNDESSSRSSEHPYDLNNDGDCSTAESFISDVTTDGYLVKHAKSVKSAKSECGDSTYYRLGLKASVLRKVRRAFRSKRRRRQDGSLDQFMEEELLKNGNRNKVDAHPEPTYAYLFREELRKRLKSRKMAQEKQMKKSLRNKNRRGK